MRQIVLDTETTGISTKDGHRVIEIGCVEMIGRRLTGAVFHHYINPERVISPGAARVHGIRDEFLKDKPKFQDIAESFKEFVGGAELIIHNAPFDVGFLDNEFLLTKNAWKSLKTQCTILDTLALARKMHPGQKNNLDALCKRYNINNTHRTLHGALLDSEILAELYLMMTGGQTVLNLESEAPLASSEKTERDFKMIDLPIVKATALELSAHEEFLASRLNH